MLFHKILSLFLLLISTNDTNAFTSQTLSLFSHERKSKSFLSSAVNPSSSSSPSSSSTNENQQGTSSSKKTQQEKKEHLLNLLSQVIPNQATSKKLTNQILNSVSELEPYCPTETDLVLQELNGNWELLWTAADSKEVRDINTSGGSSSSSISNRSLFGNWINPLENQSYSNNPYGSPSASASASASTKQGRSNPILPQNIQDKLEDIGILIPNDNSYDNNNDNESVVKSSQAVDLKKGRVRNVVSVIVNNPKSLFPSFPSLPSLPFLPSLPTTSSSTTKKEDFIRGSITVDVNFKPNKVDKRKIDVKFNECRVTLRNSPLDLKIPLGPIGPTGWLRCTYIDDTMRITRGHKGSVFILTRTSTKRR